MTFCTLLYETQYAFSVESNSTVSSLSYDSDNRTLSFTVTGTEETLGYAKVNVDKRLVPNVELLKVYVGEAEHNYTATEGADSLIIMFAYSHSVHQVEIELDYTIPELQTRFLLLGLVAASLLMVAARLRVGS